MAFPAAWERCPRGPVTSPFHSPCASLVLVRLCQRHVRHLQGDALSQLMNGPIKKKLKIIPEDLSWGGTNVT
jgi:hypothetical protein